MKLGFIATLLLAAVVTCLLNVAVLIHGTGSSGGTVDRRRRDSMSRPRPHTAAPGRVPLATAPPTDPPAPVPAQTDLSTAPFRHNRTIWPEADLEAMLAARVGQRSWRTNEAKNAAARSFQAARLAATGCDVLGVPFDPSRDGACLAYAENAANWVELRPLPMRFDARTIKFHLALKDGRLHNVLKVPQRLFPYEAASEVAAFHADRLLEVRRIPPTAWVCIPTAMIRAAVDRYGDTVETQREFLKDSGVATYREWIEKDLIRYAHQSRNIQNKGGDDECIGASMQLHMADVHHMLDSPLRIPYRAHNRSWHRYFDLRRPEREVQSASFAPSLVHIAEITAFDYITGNDDRSPNKNNFVVGRCDRGRALCNEDQLDRDRPVHPGHPTFVHLDQGMAFYRTPSNNPITHSKHALAFCVFRAPMLNRLAHLLARDGHFAHELSRRLPSGVARVVRPSTAAECEKRARHVLHRARECLAEPYRDWVVTP